MSNITIDSVGNKEWHDNDGVLHRLAGPAFEGINGSKAWWVNGKYHRLDGPAVEPNDRDNTWWVNDVRYHDFNDFQKAGGLSDDQMCVLRLKYGEIK
jgi:hypothetical protein